MFGSKGGNGRGILSMTDHEKTRNLAPIKTVESYWLGLCGDEQVPLRSQVDPRGIESALENAFLLEKIAPSMAKLRVAGSHLSDLMGMQVSGMPLSSLISPGDRERFGQAVERLFAEPSIVHLTLRADDGFGKPAIEGHMILMPLRSDFGDVSRGLGALVTKGRIGRTPRRFKITSIEVTPALKPGVLAPLPGTPAALEGTQHRRLPGFAEARAGYEQVDQMQAAAQEKPALAQRGHLKLIVSND
ncbi:MAG: PAS domain-containing protein [Pelagimonas sp.]|jgi:hypothetical protein|nr:PAS domain-containing protein [Pelagimonas sp.]